MEAREKQAELNATLGNEHNDDEEEEANADINFEVRAEKLKGSTNQVIVNDVVDQQVKDQKADNQVAKEQCEEVDDQNGSKSIYDAPHSAKKEPSNMEQNRSAHEGSHLS